MCDMYGHGYFDEIETKIHEDFMRCNSHREIVSNPMRVFCNAPHPNIFVRDVKDRFIPEMDRNITEYELIPVGIDPINSKATQKCNTKASGICSLLLEAHWDVAFPTVDSLCPWIETHFGKRGDVCDWLHRGPHLTGSPYEVFGMGMGQILHQNELMSSDDIPDHVLHQFSLSLIDAFRRRPNEYWKKSRYDKRADRGKYILDTLYERN